MSAQFEKKAKVLKEYESKCISKYDPPQSKPEIFWMITDFDFSSPHPFCGHILFPSPSMFIDHILYILHPKSFHSHIDQKHFSSLYLIISYGVCTNCIVTMLSKITFQDVINLYSISMREHVMSIYGRSGIGSMLYLYIFCHPKMHRIIMKTCKLNKKMYLNGAMKYELNKINGNEEYVHDFDYICDIIVGEAARSIPGNEDLIRIQNFYGCIMAYLRTLYLSIKYWKKYEVLFFVKQYLLELELSWIKMHKMLVENEDIKHLLDINALIKYSFIRISKKTKKLRCNEIGDIEVINVLKRYLNENNVNHKQESKDEKKGMKSIMCCGSYKCCKKQKDFDKPFKVCKQCKMTYYCSRRCQKKSWKADHKKICLKLCKYYKL